MFLSPYHDKQANAILKWNIFNIKYLGIRIPEFDIVRCKVKNTFGFQPYKWQTTVILDILKDVDIAVHTRISSRKSLPLKTIPTVKIGPIILLVSLTVTLIEDQIDDLLILLLSYPVFDDVLVFYNAKKKDQSYYTNF